MLNSDLQNALFWMYLGTNTYNLILKRNAIMQHIVLLINAYI